MMNELAKKLEVANKKLVMALQGSSPQEAEVALALFVRDLRDMKVGPHDVALVVRGASTFSDQCLDLLQHSSKASSENLELLRANTSLRMENLMLTQRIALLEDEIQSRPSAKPKRARKAAGPKDGKLKRVRVARTKRTERSQAAS
jgi:hypothetical protein